MSSWPTNQSHWGAQGGPLRSRRQDQQRFDPEEIEPPLNIDAVGRLILGLGRGVFLGSNGLLEAERIEYALLSMTQTTVQSSSTPSSSGNVITIASSTVSEGYGGDIGSDSFEVPPGISIIVALPTLRRTDLSLAACYGGLYSPGGGVLLSTAEAGVDNTFSIYAGSTVMPLYSIHASSKPQKYALHVSSPSAQAVIVHETSSIIVLRVGSYL